MGLEVIAVIIKMEILAHDESDTQQIDNNDLPVSGEVFCFISPFSKKPRARKTRAYIPISAFQGTKFNHFSGTTLHNTCIDK